MGFQYPYDGGAYVGIYTIASNYAGDATYRECISSKLTTTLTVGTTYFFSMQVARGVMLNPFLSDSVGGADCSNETNAATNKIGVLFTTNKYDITNNVPISNFAHIYSSGIISDTTNWTRISGTFISDSAYQYINIGNFFDDAHTDTLRTVQWQNPTPCHAYYYIDSLSLSADNSMGIDNIYQEKDILAFPNPVQNDYFFIKSNSLSQSISIYNQYGQSIKYKTSFVDGKTSKILFDEEIEKGIYILEITSKNKIYHFSLIKN